MPLTTIQRRVNLLLRTPLATLDARLTPAWRRADSYAVCDALDALIERAARVRGYLDARTRLGLTHGEAVRNSNALGRKIRRALGYTQHGSNSNVTF